MQGPNRLIIDPNLMKAKWAFTAGNFRPLR